MPPGPPGQAGDAAPPDHRGAGETPAPVTRMMGKELDYLASHRFEREFAWAVAELVSGRIDVAPILSGQFRFEEADAAFAPARDRTRAMKVHLTPA